MRYAMNNAMFKALHAAANSATGTVTRRTDASVTTILGMARAERKWVEPVWGAGVKVAREIVSATVRPEGWAEYRAECARRNVAPGQRTQPRRPLAARVDAWDLVAAVNGAEIEIPF
ncbi:hypothetical protein [Dactylosporangium sp. CS-033363]|uniref:hypothetical protein n=1 Tax=Dactylosporangium sp. CS-033363 TaxID=3239935 RepID=UPI003D932F9C